MRVASAVIDDLGRDHPLATTGSRWRLLTDQVMGGVSAGTLVREIVAGRVAIRLRGDVSLDNNGGFVQMALDLAPDGTAVDAGGWSGVELDVFGDGQDYNVHLRTDVLTRPWQSYRQTFTAPAEWRTVRLPFDGFVPHRTDAALDPRRLRRMGVVAIGRVTSFDLALSGLRFMTTPDAFDAETLDFYGREARAYANRRESASRALPGFLARLPPGGAILELGCGGGQDAEAMIAAGFDVTPTDGSAELAAEAQARLGRPVRVMRFDALDLEDRFDGVWANACLLHAPAEALAGILRRIRRALKDGGVFWASFKAGDGGARDALGRYNNLISRRFLETTLRESGPWGTVEYAEARAGSHDGEVYTWLSCTAVKASSSPS